MLLKEGDENNKERHISLRDDHRMRYMSPQPARGQLYLEALQQHSHQSLICTQNGPALQFYSPNGGTKDARYFSPFGQPQSMQSSVENDKQIVFQGLHGHIPMFAQRSSAAAIDESPNIIFQQRRRESKMSSQSKMSQYKTIQTEERRASKMQQYKDKDQYQIINVQLSDRQCNTDSENAGLLTCVSINNKHAQSAVHNSQGPKPQQGPQHIDNSGHKSRLRVAKQILDNNFIKFKSLHPMLAPSLPSATGNQMQQIEQVNWQNENDVSHHQTITIDNAHQQRMILEQIQAKGLYAIPIVMPLTTTAGARYQIAPTWKVNTRYRSNQNPNLIRNGPQKQMARHETRTKDYDHKDEYIELFAKLGLSYESDVPQTIKDQLKIDKNAKQILIQLGNEFEKSGQSFQFEVETRQPEPTKPAQPGAQRPRKPRVPTVAQATAPPRQEKPPAPPPDPTAINPNACFSVSPGEPTTIKIINETKLRHQQHPINKFLKNANDFCFLTLVKANNFRGSHNQKVPSFDVPQIQNLSRMLKLDIPKNLMQNDLYQLFRSKQFINQSKAQVLQKLYSLINKENDIKLNFERSNFQFYKGFIGKGNNTALIVSLFKHHRWWWSIFQSLPYDEEGNPILPYSVKQAVEHQNMSMLLYKENFQEHNFLWTQWKKLKHFPHLKEVRSEQIPAGSNISNSIKVYAKLENHYHLSNKYALFYNMRKYYKACHRDPFDVLPLTFHIKKGSNDPKFQKFQATYKIIENQRINAAAEEKEQTKRQKGLKKEIKALEDKLANLSLPLNDVEDQHEPETQEQLDDPSPSSPQSRKDYASFLPKVQGNKKNLIIDEQLLRKMHVQKKQQILEKERCQRELNVLQTTMNEVKQKLKQLDKHKRLKNIWIIKPGENTNRGVGISVQTKLSEIKAKLNSGCGDSRTFIVQRYIENPALYKNRKFDIRCFAIITSINSFRKGFVYDDGYLRTSGREFDLKNFNKIIHLTNDAVQKRSEDYGRFEFGNKVSFQEYQQHLNQSVPQLNINFRQHVFSQIKQIMTDTIRATSKVIDPLKRQHSFEVFGYDFMLDEDFKVYLIEVNTNPCLETTCPILHKIITDVLDSGFRLSLDPLFPPPNYQKRISTQIPLTQWELVFDSKLDDPELDRLYDEYEKRQDELLQEKKEVTTEQDPGISTGATSKDECRTDGQNDDAAALAQIMNDVEKDDFDEDLIKEEELDEVYD